MYTSWHIYIHIHIYISDLSPPFSLLPSRSLYAVTWHTQASE